MNKNIQPYYDRVTVSSVKDSPFRRKFSFKTWFFNRIDHGYLIEEREGELIVTRATIDDSVGVIRAHFAASGWVQFTYKTDLQPGHYQLDVEESNEDQLIIILKP